MPPKPLFMTRPVTPIDLPPLPAGYTYHQYRRGGDEVLSAEQYRRSWLEIIVQMYDHPVVMDFHRVNDDPRLPEDAFFLILDSEKHIIASAMILLGEYAPDAATLHMVVADTAHRGQGFGSAVIRFALRYATENGVSRTILRTQDTRLAAIRAYLRLGFIPVLNDTDMRQRWLAVMAQLGKDEIPVYKEDGTLTTLNRT